MRNTIHAKAHLDCFLRCFHQTVQFSTNATLTCVAFVMMWNASGMRFATARKKLYKCNILDLMQEDTVHKVLRKRKHTTFFFLPSENVLQNQYRLCLNKKCRRFTSFCDDSVQWPDCCVKLFTVIPVLLFWYRAMQIKARQTEHNHLVETGLGWFKVYCLL